jgi:membrane protease YdiL (CAAX protease family)
MKQLFTSRYFLGFAAVYAATMVAMSFINGFPLGEAIGVLVVVGIGFSLVAHFASRGAKPSIVDKPKQPRELWLLLGMVIYISLFLTYGASAIQDYFAVEIAADPSAKDVIKILYKLLFFVLIPFLAYKFIYGFSLRDFGLAPKARELFSKKNVLIFVVMATVILVFQYFAGAGAKPIREGLLSGQQFAIATPLFFLWLLFEVGLVEEFFFRGILQTRFAAVLKSELGGVFVSGLLFGLAHSPGFYLRGAGMLDNLGAHPGLAASIGYGILVLSVSGFLFSIIWSRTRSLWLVMAIHATMDFLPGLYEFVQNWGIK